MRQRIYTDTSVIGGCFDSEFKEFSIALIKEFKSGIKIMTLSDLTLKELEHAPLKVRSIIKEIPNANIEYIELDESAKYLAAKYIEEKAIHENYFVDSQHIALSTVNRNDVLVSWNFKHIVKHKTRIEVAGINTFLGYKVIDICSPQEVLDNE